MAISLSVDLDKVLMDDLQTIADHKHIHIDEYITSLLEEEILKEITTSLVSDSSIY